MSQHRSRADLLYEDDYLLPGGHVYLDELHKVYVERSGTGPPLLAVPGMTGDGGELVSLGAALDGEFTVVRPDRRGYSRSPRGWTKSSIDEQASDLARLMEVLGLDGYALFAPSAGAAVALKLLARFPGRVRGAVLHEPWVPALLPPGAAAAALAAGEQAVIEARARRNTGPFEARLRFLMGPAFESLPPEVRQRVFKNGEMHAAECVYSDDWLPPVPHLFAGDRARVLVTAGARSHPFVREMTGRLAADLGVGLLEVEGMHAPYLDDAPGYLAAVRPHLSTWSERA